MTGADSLAQTVRDAVDYGVWSSRRAPALRALDELVGRLDQAERERDFLRLELEAARHNWKKDNEFLLARAEKEECGRIVRTQPEGGAG